MSMSMDPDFEVKEMIAEARLKLRGAVGELTAEEVAAVDRKKRAWDFKMKVTMKLGIKEAISGLRLEVVFVNDSPVAQFKCFDKVFYFRPLKAFEHKAFWPAMTSAVNDG